MWKLLAFLGMCTRHLEETSSLTAQVLHKLMIRHVLCFQAVLLVALNIGHKWLIEVIFTFGRTQVFSELCDSNLLNVQGICHQFRWRSDNEVTGCTMKVTKMWSVNQMSSFTGNKLLCGMMFVKLSLNVLYILSLQVSCASLLLHLPCSLHS